MTQIEIDNLNKDDVVYYIYTGENKLLSNVYTFIRSANQDHIVYYVFKDDTGDLVYIDKNKLLIDNIQKEMNEINIKKFIKYTMNGKNFKCKKTVKNMFLEKYPELFII